MASSSSTEVEGTWALVAQADIQAQEAQKARKAKRTQEDIQASVDDDDVSLEEKTEIERFLAAGLIN